MTKKTLLVFILLSGFCLMPFSGPGPVLAGEVDILIKKLVEKGILSQEEASALLTEMKNESLRTKNTVEQVASEKAAEVAQKEAKKASADIPKWVQNVNFKGDFRLRYQRENTEEDDKQGRSRMRLRWRVGAEAKVADQWETGFGFASGSDDPRSTNQTLENSFQSPDARLDYAYVKWMPHEMVSMIGGKFKNPIWKPKDLMWDGDIRPDGIAAPLNFKLDGVTLFVNPAWFTLEEFSSDRDDPYIAMLQAGVMAKLPANLYINGAAAYYDFKDMKGNSFPHSAGGNTKSGGVLAYEFKCWNLDAEFGMKIKDSFFGKWAVFGQYVENTDPSDNNQGWLAGFKFGSAELKKFLDWEVKYNYRKLEADAWPDILPDSDFYGGATNAKGHELEVNFGLAKNVVFGIDYYWDVKPIEGSHTNRDQYVLQADLVVKW